MARPSTALLPAGVTLLALAFLQAPLAAQATVDFTGRSHLFVGYSASPPQQMLGFAVTFMSDRFHNLGLMADARFTSDSPAGNFFVADRTPGQADTDGDIFLRQRSAWGSVGASVVKGLTPEFAVYAGGGATWETVYLQYEDETREFGQLGIYWIEDPEQSTIHPNVTLGAFLRMGGRLMVQVGGQTAPRGFTLGGHFRIL